MARRNLLGFRAPASRKPNADHVAWTRFVTLAFWQAYLSQHDAARAWLQSDGLVGMSKGAATISHK